MGGLSPKRVEEILQRLGLAATPDLTRAGLDTLYRGWCRNIPFDNARKRLALRRSAPGPFPGGDPDEFFSFWLRHGAAGTCWPTSNALGALLAACGFDVRRISASMFDTGVRNHGSLLVRLEGRELLVDSSMLTEASLELTPGGSFEQHHALLSARGEAHDAGWLLHFSNAWRPEPVPCRLLDDPVDEPFYLERYEASREDSPFNAFLYARRNHESHLINYLATTRFERNADGIHQQVLDGSDFAHALTRDIGYSEELVDELLREGAVHAE